MSIGFKTGVTYHSDFQNMKSITTPVIDNDVRMGYKGHFEKDWDLYEMDFDSFGYGLKKTRHNSGIIFCNDSSKLFSMGLGYVGMILSFPKSFINGVYSGLLNNVTINEHFLWGVNPGKTKSYMPCLYSSLTNNGIEFTVWSSACKFTLIDQYSNFDANTDIFMEFLWDKDGIIEYSEIGYLPTMLIRMNGSDIVVGNAPIFNDSISNLSCYILDTPFLYSNLECTIRSLVIANEIPERIEDDWYSSSSSSSSSSEMYSTSSSSSSSADVFILKGSIGNYPSQFASVNSIWNDGTYIYIADAVDGGLAAYTFNGTTFIEIDRIIDGITNPFSAGVWGDGTYIYLANGEDGLRAYQFNGTNFITKGHVNDGGIAVSVWGNGTYIYLANGTGGLRSYSFDGTNFIARGNIATSGYATGVYGISGSFIHVADGLGGLRAYSHNGSSFASAGNIYEGDEGDDAYLQVWAYGSYIYVTCATGGLRAYSYNGSVYTPRGYINDTSFSIGIHGDGTYIYVNDDLVGKLNAYIFNGSIFSRVASVYVDDSRSFSVFYKNGYIFAGTETSLRAYVLADG